MLRYLSILGFVITVILLIITLATLNASVEYITIDSGAYATYADQLSNDAETALQNGDPLRAALYYQVLLNLNPAYQSDQLTGLNSQITELNAQHTELNTQLTELNTRITQLNANVATCTINLDESDSEQLAASIAASPACLTLLRDFQEMPTINQLSQINIPLVTASPPSLTERTEMLTEEPLARFNVLQILGYVLALVSLAFLAIQLYRSTKQESLLQAKLAQKFINPQKDDILGEIHMALFYAEKHPGKLSYDYLQRCSQQLLDIIEYVAEIKPVPAIESTEQQIRLDKSIHTYTDTMAFPDGHLVYIHSPGWKHDKRWLRSPLVSTRPYRLTRGQQDRGGN